MSASESIKVIVNPAAGHGASFKQLKKLEEAAGKLGLRLLVELTEYPGHATEIAARAAEEETSLVGVMGGDGTIGEVVNGLVGSDAILGIIATGTGNDVARSLGLPLNNPGQSLEVIFTGKVTQIDVGDTGERYFVSVLGVGFPATVAVEANKMRRFGGSSVFLLAMYRSLLSMKSYPLQLSIDGELVEGCFTSVVVQNTPYTGGGLLIAPSARLDDGLLDVITVGRIGKVDLMMNLPKLYTGKHLGHAKFSLIRCRTLSIKSRHRLPVMFDGDLFGCTPVVIENRGRAVNVLVKR